MLGLSKVAVLGLSQNAEAYAAEQFLLEETFLRLKIRGLLTIAASNQERLIMAPVRYIHPFET